MQPRKFLPPLTSMEQHAHRREVIPTVWVQPGETVTVRGIKISCGYFYLSNGLKAEPSQIDPTLETSFLTADGLYLDAFVPIASYQEFTPEHRGAFLSWLADDRPIERAHLAFIELLLAGVERRVVIDIRDDPSLRSELPELRRFVEKLATFEPPEYDDELFDEEPEYVFDDLGFAVIAEPSAYYADEYDLERLRYLTTRLLDLIDAVLYELTGELPGVFPYIDVYETPICLYLALADRAARRTPVTASLALAWGTHHERVKKRKAAAWHPLVFARLFELRFAEAYPKGITVRAGSRWVKLDYYRFAAGGANRTFLINEAPNIFDNAAQLSKISMVFDQVEYELAQFVRILNGPPVKGQRLLAIGSLPRELIGLFPDETTLMREVVAKWIDDREWTTVEGAKLIARWPVSTPGQLTGFQSKSLFKVLDVLGYGVEPDLRFFGPVVTGQSTAIVFRQDPQAPESGDVVYNGARVVALLGAMVAQAGGTVDSSTIELISCHAGEAFALAPALQHRLGMHLRWLLLNPVKTNGLAKQAQSLGITGMERLGHLLCAFTIADGGATPAKMKALGKAYSVLGLDPALVTSHLHAAYTGDRAPTRDVIDIRSPLKRDTESSPTGVKLDPGVVIRKIAESSEISTVLSDLFAEDEAARPPANVAPSDRLGQLDGAHAQLLRALMTRDLWQRTEFETLAAQFNLMPEGAIDTLNEAAFEAAGEPLLEGDDMLAVNANAARELNA